MIAGIQLDKNDLDRKIQVDGKIVTVREATAEQFDIYVYSMLYQIYSRRKRAENRYEVSFWEHNYAALPYRLIALNKLYMLSLERARVNEKPVVSLFVEEQAHG